MPPERRIDEARGVWVSFDSGAVQVVCRMWEGTTAPRSLIRISDARTSGLLPPVDPRVAESAFKQGSCRKQITAGNRTRSVAPRSRQGLQGRGPYRRSAGNTYLDLRWMPPYAPEIVISALGCGCVVGNRGQQEIAYDPRKVDASYRVFVHFSEIDGGRHSHDRRLLIRHFVSRVKLNCAIISHSDGGPLEQG